ncbi:MAG: hypothetical protein GF353_11990 [Candidatus Lokiarchaeota archaeon]|nr:hypothetical protein [Candidatus Lokiarchaeota archaeon]
MRTLYSNPNKEQREWTMVNLLREYLKIFDKKDILKSESPDFLINNNQGKIGIEITTPFNTRNPQDIHPMAIRAVQEKVMNNLYNRLKTHEIDPIELKIHFINDYDYIDENEVTDFCLNFALSKINMIDDKKTHHFYNINHKSVNWISIHLHTTNGKKWLDDHTVHRIHMNWVNINPKKQIQMAIDEKQKKLKNYKNKCTQCWLVLGVHEWTTVEAIKIINDKDQIYYCDFDRLFFIRAIEGEVLECKKLKWVPDNERK